MTDSLEAEGFTDKRPGVFFEVGKEETQRICKRTEEGPVAGGTSVIIDELLQEFTYSFHNCAQELHFKRVARGLETQQELEELLALYGDKSVMLALSGGLLRPIASLQEARKVRDWMYDQGSLLEESATVQWKLYLQTAEDLESFIGIIGLSMEDQFGLRLLKPHVCLTKNYQKQGFGPKSLVCLLARVLQHRSWFYENVQGVLLEFHPENEACEKLRKRWFGKTAVAKEDSERINGTWFANMFEPTPTTDESTPVSMRRFLVKGTAALETFLKSKIKQGVEDSTRLVLTNWKITEAKSKAPPTFSATYVEDIEASLQDFSYTFNYEAGPETLVFRTYKRYCTSIDELHGLLDMFGDDDLMQMFVGTPGLLHSLSDAEKMRADYQTRNSFVKAPHSFYWQLYVKTSTRVEFMGLIGISLLKHGGKTYLNPDLVLLPHFQKKRIGNKALTCVIHKLLSVKEWLVTLCDGVYVRIRPENRLSLGLKDSMLQKRDSELLNPERSDGLWHLGPRKYDGVFMETLVKRIFCPGIETLCNLLSQRFQMNLNKTELQYLIQDNSREGEREALSRDCASEK